MERTSELQRSQSQIADMLDSIKDGFFALDQEGLILYINQRAAQNVASSLRASGAEYLGEIPAVPGSLLAEKCREVLEQRQAVHFEMPGIIRQLHYEISIYPSTEGVTVYWIDISERKRAELALQKERDRAQSYLNIAGAMIVVLDAEQKVSLINTRGCQILGCVEEEVTGANWFERFIPEKLRTECIARLCSMLAGEIELTSDISSSAVIDQRRGRSG